MATFSQARYEVWLGTPGGQRLALLDQLSRLQYVLALNAVSRWSITVPFGSVDPAFVRPDMTVAVWRSVGDGPAQLQTAGFVKGITYQGIGNDSQITLSGPDANDLLRSRIVAYYAGSAQAEKTDYADDMMKEVVAENLGSSATDTDRDLSNYGVSVQGDQSLGPSIKLAFAYDVVLDALRDIADAARENGTALYFRMVPVALSNTQIGYVFTTGINKLGADRTYAGKTPTVFSRAWGNLEAPTLGYDYNDEVNYVYAGGGGEGEDREIVEESDTLRIARSLWGRREGWIDARNQNDTNGIETIAKAGLDIGKPVISFVGTLKDTPQTRYGVEWNFGDRVSATEFGKQFDGIVDKVRIGIDGSGTETITARIEVD